MSNKDKKMATRSSLRQARADGQKMGRKTNLYEYHKKHSAKSSEISGSEK